MLQYSYSRGETAPSRRSIAVKLNNRRTILVGLALFVDLYVLADVRQRDDPDPDRHI